MGTTTETRITSTQAKDAIYKAHELVGQDLVTQAELDAVVLDSGNLTPEQAQSISNITGLTASSSELNYSVNINDFMKVSKNLFKKSNINNEGYLSVNGTIAYHAFAKYTGYIAIKPSTSYSYQGVYGGTTRHIIYDSTKTVIQVLPANDTTTPSLVNNTILTPPNAAYIRLSIRDVNTFMIEKGSSISTYSEYFDSKILTTTPISGQNIIDFMINGVNARLTTSSNYGTSKDTLMILCHGNTLDYKYKPSQTFIDYCMANKISFACISAQDQTTAPFTTDAVGWGGAKHIQRITQLYDYLMENYNFHKSVILVGSSMGGLAMGTLAYYRPFPIKFCLGIGSVPSLEYIFLNGGDNRKRPIRKAYGMADDGSDDANLSTFTQGYDWFKTGTVNNGTKDLKLGFPRMYLYLGTGDSTATVEFGGDLNYLKIKNAINDAGGKCTYTNVGASYSHTDNGIYDIVLSDGIMTKELLVI